MTPSENLFKSLKLLETEFCKYHGKRIRVNIPQVTKDLVKDLITMYPEIDPSVISLYIRTRTFARIKYINKTLTEEENRKRMQKMSKILY